MTTDRAATDDLRLASADNLRDVVGPGYATRAGDPLRRGVFYRANLLRFSEEDLAAVGGLGLRRVHDLRRADEVAQHPDAEIAGATWHHHDVLGVAPEDALDLSEVAQAVAMMEQVYTDFVRSERSRAAFAALFRHLAEDVGGPQLFHCTAGKDRTGWAAAVLLEHAGMDPDAVLTDYLLSNERTRSSRAAFEARIAEGLGEDRVPVLAPVLEVREDYLAISRRLVTEDYGDLTGYLRDGLGLDDGEREALRLALTG